jgi:hypothetical protein
LFDASGSRLRYVIIAWPIATLPTLLLAPLLIKAKVALNLALPHPTHWTSTLAVTVVVVAPLVETGLMLLAYYLLGFVIRRSRILRALVLAALAAVAHVGSFGGWLHVVGVAWLFVVLSIALAAWVERRAWSAFVVVSSVHLLHNAVVFALGASLAKHYAT